MSNEPRCHFDPTTGRYSLEFADTRLRDLAALRSRLGDDDQPGRLSQVGKARIEIDHSKSQLDLAEAIKGAADGDTIAVRSEAMLELAERARKRMCPDKAIHFEVLES